MRILALKMGDRGVNVFSTLAPHSIGASPLHSHPYAEIHIFIEGDGEYHIEGARYALAVGDAVLIPAGQLHATATSGGSRVFVLQADLAVATVQRLSLPAAMLSALASAEGEEIGGVIPVLCYLVASFSGPALYSVRQNDDYAYLIHEYVEQNYHRPLRLGDLAAVLHLSERQTQRIIRSLFGVSFSELLASHRVSVAERLAATTEMPWARIAEYVGYETYSGFRRAYRRHDAGE